MFGNFIPDTSNPIISGRVALSRELCLEWVLERACLRYNWTMYTRRCMTLHYTWRKQSVHGGPLYPGWSWVTEQVGVRWSLNDFQAQETWGKACEHTEDPYVQSFIHVQTFFSCRIVSIILRRRAFEVPFLNLASRPRNICQDPRHVCCTHSDNAGCYTHSYACKIIECSTRSLVWTSLSNRSGYVSNLARLGDEEYALKLL